MVDAVEVAHEACGYEGVERLQDVVVQRYHGVFEAQILGRSSALS